MVQIAFKLLTLKGLPETFLAALRDARNLNFRQSLMGSIESTVAYGPVYFNTQPNLQLSLSDVNILDALTLNVKMHGYNYAPGSELICDKPVERVKINPKTNIVQDNDYISDKDIPSASEMDFDSNDISFLDKKLDDLTVLIKDMSTSKNITDITSTSGSKSGSQIVHTHIQRPPEIQDFKFKSFGDLEELLDKKLSGLNIKPIDLSKDFADKIDATFDYKNDVLLEFNKLRSYPKKNSKFADSRYADKPRMQTYYYNRPTPQDVLIEERDWNQTNTSYSGFTGQLRGWWDNYLTVEERALVIKAKAIDEGVDNLGMALVANREDAVYTLILTILEHFNGRFTNQNEIVRTLLNGLRCKTLGEFRWYKDTFMSRVMKLPENKLEHWKAKFIDGLPSLFAERVRKILRGSYGEIPYVDYTYGKQLKMDKLKEKSQLGDFCTQFGLPETFTHKKKKHKYHRYPNQDSPYRRKRSRYRSKEEREAKKAHRKATRFTKNRSKRDLADIKCYKCGKLGHIAPNCKLQKLKTLGLDDELRDKVYGLLYTSGEIENLKREIKSLKKNQMICDHRITQIEKINSLAEKSNDKNKGISENNIEEKPISFVPYEDNFSEDDIPTKSRLCQMNAELVEFCKKEIDSLLQKGLIKPSKSPWSCTTFYVNNAAKKERGIPRLAYLTAKNQKDTSAKQSDTFASITKDDNDDIKSYEKDPKTKALYGQELLDSIKTKIQEYSSKPQKEVIDDSSVRHIARKISFQERDKAGMINNYLEEVKRNLLRSINQYEKSDTSMQSETSNDDIAKDSQPFESEKILYDEDFESMVVKG
ncbi:uncharacterized protein [Nicotiana tomentosiformis]|uniref:uncharacterized protein n=1 Tax=Nicotiana tomentosiformis TaxID=4098 RepID=UPI00388CBF3C